MKSFNIYLTIQFGCPLAGAGAYDDLDYEDGGEMDSEEAAVQRFER
jgi:hypothetical protein